MFDAMTYSFFKNQIDLIAIGCSAGSIEVLQKIFTSISAAFRVPIVIVQHRSSHSTSLFVKHFSHQYRFKLIEPEDKEPIQEHCIYVAPAHYHLLIGADKCFNLSVDEEVHFSCPAIDVLFVSAAEVFKKRVMGIILSGANSDGAMGLQRIKTLGGLTVVQSPETAEFPQMPHAALELIKPDYVANVNQICELINAV